MDMYSINIVVTCQNVMSIYNDYVYRKHNLAAVTLLRKIFVFAV